MRLRAVSPGSWERLSATSNELAVSVKPLLEINAPTVAKAGVEFAISVRAVPNEGSFNLEELVKGKWVQIDQVTLGRRLRACSSISPALREASINIESPLSLRLAYWVR